MRGFSRLLGASVAAVMLGGCDAPHFYPQTPGDPAVPRPAHDVAVTRAPVRFVPHAEHERIRVVRLHPVSRGTLPPTAPFPIVAEKVAPDGTTRSLSTQHAIDAYGSPQEFLGSRDGSTWFAPQTTVTHSYGGAPADAGMGPAVTGDGTAWFAYDDGRIASIASDGRTSYYQSPATVISRIVGGSGSSLLIFDAPTHGVYRVGSDRTCWYVGRFPQLDPVRGLPETGTNRDAMWFGDATSVSAIADDGSQLSTISTLGPATKMLAGDALGIWTITNNGYRNSYDAALDHYSLDGTASRFRIASSLVFARNIAPDGDLLIEAEIPGSGATSFDRHFFEIDARGRGTETTVVPGKGASRGMAISGRSDGALLVGWSDVSFATIDRDGAVSITDMPRP